MDQSDAGALCPVRLILALPQSAHPLPDGESGRERPGAADRSAHGVLRGPGEDARQDRPAVAGNAAAGGAPVPGRLFVDSPAWAERGAHERHQAYTRAADPFGVRSAGDHPGLYAGLLSLRVPAGLRGALLGRSESGGKRGDHGGQPLADHADRDAAARHAGHRRRDGHHLHAVAGKLRRAGGPRRGVLRPDHADLFPDRGATST